MGALLFLAGNCLADTNAPSLARAEAPVDFSKIAQKAYQTARAKYLFATNNVEAAWQFGRTCFDWAEYATSDDQREEIAQEGIAACQQLADRKPESAVAHYYLAMNLGQLARTKDLGALRIVSRMEGEFKKVLSLDPDLDYAGADRNLGLLYLEAPGWPASIGSKTKAKLHLQSALKRAPNYPENLINLIEAYLKWGDKIGAARELAALDALWESAHKQFSGDEWMPGWSDWKKRKEVVTKKLGNNSQALQTPRAQP